MQVRCVPSLLLWILGLGFWITCLYNFKLCNVGDVFFIYLVFLLSRQQKYLHRWIVFCVKSEGVDMVWSWFQWWRRTKLKKRDPWKRWQSSETKDGTRTRAGRSGVQERTRRRRPAERGCESSRAEEGLKWTALDGVVERVRHNWISCSLPSSEVV